MAKVNKDDGKPEEFLLGSSKQPALFKDSKGATVQLGTLVAEAQTKSGLTVEEWNSLDDDSREGAIEFAIVEMSLRAYEPKSNKVAKEKPADVDPDHIEVTKDGDTLYVHPGTVEAHVKAGWEVA